MSFIKRKRKKVVVTKAWPWTMLLQLQTFCCGETRRKHLHISLLFFCCFTGFFFLGELSSHLRPRFCCWSVLSFLDLALYHQRCKHRCPWRLNWIILCFYWILYLFFLNCKSFHYLFLGFFFWAPPRPPKKKKNKKKECDFIVCFCSLFFPLIWLCSIFCMARPLRSISQSSFF